MKKTTVFFLFSCFTLTITTSAYSQPPSGQTGGGLQRQEQQIQTERRLEKQIKEKKKKPEEPVTEEKPSEAIPEGQKNLISKIDVQGVTLVPKEVIDKIIKDYEGKDLGVANVGLAGTAGTFDGGVKAISYPMVTPDSKIGNYPGGNPGANRGHSAVITIFEACWFNTWGVSYAKDAGAIMETGAVTISDVHDFASVYGEFLSTGNDPTIGQLGSIRFAQGGFSVAQAGGGIAGNNTISQFVQ